MTSKHRIVVSTQNNAYSGWQCKLFYLSCVTRVEHQPIFMVHANGSAWHPDFYALARAGAMVLPAPCYVANAQPPRNTAGSLLHAADACGEDELIVLCDPDMIFRRKPVFPEKLSGNQYTYMSYAQLAVQQASETLGLSWELVERSGSQLCCGVPYVIPVRQARPLAKAWMQAVDAFPQRDWEEMWLDIMYAFGLATLKLGLEVALTDMVDDNSSPDAVLLREMIHYCYGGDIWNKRWFYYDEQAPEVWQLSGCAERNTVLGEIFSQIEEAGEFYRDAYFASHSLKRCS